MINAESKSSSYLQIFSRVNYEHLRLKAHSFRIGWFSGHMYFSCLISMSSGYGDKDTLKVMEGNTSNYFIRAKPNH